MANLKFNTTLRNNQLDEITSFAGTSATITFYSGTQPAGGGAETQVLVVLTCSAAAFAAAASAGVLTLNAVTGSTATASGTASWFRIKTSGGTFVMDGDISTVGGNGDLQLDNTSVVLNASVSLTGPNVINAPNAP